MYDTAQIRSTIVTLLTGIMNGANPLFAAVYDYPNPNISGSPAAIMDVTSDNGSFLDNVTNIHIVTFNIWLVQEITVLGQDSAIASLDVVSKLVIQTLEKLTNMSLGGKVNWTTPTMGGRKQVQTPNGPVFYKEVILKCNVLAQNF